MQTNGRRGSTNVDANFYVSGLLEVKSRARASLEQKRGSSRTCGQARHTQGKALSVDAGDLNSSISHFHLTHVDTKLTFPMFGNSTYSIPF